MKGELKIKKLFAGDTYYQVYRLRDTSIAHHSGNEETYGELFESRDDAVSFLKSIKGTV